MPEINNNYSQEYLNQINSTLSRMDSTENGGNGDGKASISEALADLQIGSLLSGLDPAKNEYKELKALTDQVPQALEKYAGNDKIFDAKEWADFLNGTEWGAVIDKYHASSNFAEIEMGWIDNGEGILDDGAVTKGEVKVNILNNLASKGIQVDTTEIEQIIDNYAGDDGTFTKEEYAALKGDPVFKNFLETHGVSTFINDPKVETRSEMATLDAWHINDGAVTKGEVKVEIMNSFARRGYDPEKTNIEAIIDRYAGADGTFTEAEYNAMKADSEFRDIMYKHRAKRFDVDS